MVITLALAMHQDSSGKVAMVPARVVSNAVILFVVSSLLIITVLIAPVQSQSQPVTGNSMTALGQQRWTHPAMANRSTTSGGPYTKLNSSLISGATYNDQTVQSRTIYYYVNTAVNSQGLESKATAAIPLDPWS